MRVRPGSLALITVAALVLAGCTGDSEDPPAPSPTVDEPSPTDDASPEPTGTEPTATGPTGTSTLPEDPIAAVPSNVPDVTIEVYELVRTDGAVHLTFALALDEGGEATNAYPLVGSLTTTTARNVTLFDPAGLKRYLVLEDEDGSCLCSSAHHRIEPGERRYYSALFPEPPQDVEAVTVEMPSGSVPSVPLAGG